VDQRPYVEAILTRDVNLSSSNIDLRAPIRFSKGARLRTERDDSLELVRIKLALDLVLFMGFAKGTVQENGELESAEGRIEPLHLPGT